MGKIKKIGILFLLIISAVTVIFWNLGTGSLTSWDEAVYAEISREMLNSGNWIDLTWAKQKWSDKPPLYMWFTVLFYKMFGINEFSARLFSALCGIGLIIVTYFFASRLYSRRVGFQAGFILLSTCHFIWIAKMGTLDCALTFFITLALFLFKLGEEKKKYLFFSLLTFCLAFLTKGVGALIIPIIVFIYVFSQKKMALLKEPAFLWGILVSVLILGWWHWLAISHYGKHFIQGYLVKHILMRTTSAVEGHTGGIFTYLKVLPNKGRPWGLIVLLVIPIIIWRIVAKKEKNHLLPLIWFFAVLFIFSLVRTKLHWYIAPIYPAAAILIAWAIDRVFRKSAYILIFVLSFVLLIYFGKSKNVFNLDFTPETKKFALNVKDSLKKDNKIYLYKIDDPAAQFYFGDICNYIWDIDQLNKFVGKKGDLVVFNNGALPEQLNRQFKILVANPSFIAFEAISSK